MSDQTPATQVNVREALYRILDSIKQLPSPPEVCLAVTRATQHEDTTLGDLASLVENDIALSGRLMQVANSAFFGVREPVTSMRRAISLLGFGTVRSLALGYFFNEEFGKLCLPGLPYPDLPRFALASSVIAETVAKQAAPELAADAACLGLLHESGVIVMAMAFGAQYRRMVAGIQHNNGQTLEQAEAAMFGINHVMASKLLLKGWQMSDVFVEAAAHHHADGLADDMSPAATKMWQVIRLASHAALLFFDASSVATSDKTIQTAEGFFGWSPADFGKSMQSAARMYEQRMAITGVGADVIEQDTQMAMQAGERMLSIESAA